MAGIKKFIYIGIGGMLGALLRFAAKNADYGNMHEFLPLGTLFVNVTGSFLLALVSALSFEVWKLDTDIRLAITTGFLGAYTTFSTFCKEAAGFLEAGLYVTALLYILLSVLLGFGGVYAGAAVARAVNAVFMKRDACGEEPPVHSKEGGTE